MNNLDPLPYVHSCWDDGMCSRHGQRSAQKGVSDEFLPREGYSQDERDYLRGEPVGTIVVKEDIGAYFPVWKKVKLNLWESGEVTWEELAEENQ